MKFLTPIFDPDEVKRIRETLTRVVHPSSEGDILLRKQAGWVAVPVESYSHITLMNEEQLRQLFLAHGYQDLLAVALEPMGEFPSVFVVPATAEGIEEYNRECGHFYFALFAGAPDWVIINTVDEFDVITGSPEFVSQLLGCEPEEAFVRFQEYADRLSPIFMKQLKKHMLSINSYFRDNYPTAEVGSEFTVIKLPQCN